MVEEKYINNLVLQPILSADGMQVMTYNIKKIRKTNRKADSMISEKAFDKSYINDDSNQEEIKMKKTQESYERKRGKKNKNTQKEGKKVVEEDNRPWYSKYFWVLAIGGMIGYNIMTFDKTKLKEAMEQANRQQNANQG